MKKRQEKHDGPQEAADERAATPFFARYLVGQEADEPDAEAKVSNPKDQAQFTMAEGARKKKPKPLQTRKYPSDNDEYVFYPYHVEAATKTKKGNQTLKYPSDSDEDGPYYAVYTNAEDVPKRSGGKAKDAEVHLTREAPEGTGVGNG